MPDTSRSAITRATNAASAANALNIGSEGLPTSRRGRYRCTTSTLVILDGLWQQYAPRAVADRAPATANAGIGLHRCFVGGIISDVPLSRSEDVRLGEGTTRTADGRQNARWASARSSASNGSTSGSSRPSWSYASRSVVNASTEGEAATPRSTSLDRFTEFDPERRRLVRHRHAPSARAGPALGYPRLVRSFLSMTTAFPFAVTANRKGRYNVPPLLPASR